MSLGRQVFALERGLPSHLIGRQGLRVTVIPVATPGIFTL